MSGVDDRTPSGGAGAPPRIAFVMADLGTGGIGKMRLHLTRELVERGLEVDLVLGRARGPYLDQVDPRVRLVNLGTSHPWLILPALVRYLRARRPEVVICEKLRVNLAAHRASLLAGVRPRIYASIHGVLSHKLEGENLGEAKKRSKYRDIDKTYPRNSGFITVSSGIGDDLVARFGVPRDKVHVVFNPVVTSAVLQRAREPLDHPWFIDKRLPVVIGVGRLEPQKDFATLIRAVGALPAGRSARLLILGEGSERPALEALVAELGLGDRVQLTGFVDNPYAYMMRSDVFVLSSRWEGFGNVIVEALALGIPVVSTDCPAGPREILGGGRFGHLVPIGDPDAMAGAIARTLAAPVAHATLMAEGARYTPAACANGYLKAIGLGEDPWLRP